MEPAESEVRIFGISKGWKWFFYILVPPLVLLLGYGVFVPFQTDTPAPAGARVLVPVLCGGMIAIFIYGLFSAVKSRLEIDSKEIRSVGLFKTKSMQLDKVEGFTIMPTEYVRLLVLVPKNPRSRKMKLSLCYERQSELLDWANRTLTNLDATQHQNDLVEIYHDENLGHSPEEKARNYARVRKWCRFLNSISTGVFLWGFFWPQPYQLVIWMLVATPLVALLFLKHFEGIAKMDAKRGSAYPSVAISFLTPSTCLALRALLDWHILDWHGFLKPFALVSLGLFILMLLLASDVRSKVGMVIGYAFFCSVYGYGTVVCLNGALAVAPWKAYHAEVIHKHITTGKHTDYYLILSPWGPKKENTDATVRKAVYEKYAAGDTAAIYVREGKFGIPYYVVQ
jgi:hypothetical protein